MANKLLQLPGNRLFNNSNIASPGGTATLYLSGTTTLANFLDASAVPLGPTLTANGLGQLPDAYGDETVAYRLILRDSSGVQLDGGDIDPFYFGRDNSLITTTAGSSVSTRALLAAIANPVANQSAILTESGREGTFVFDTSNLSASVTADTAQGVYVAPSSDTTGASGAWVRVDRTITPFMFGAVGDGVTDDLAALQAFNDFLFASPRTQFFDLTGGFALSGQLFIGPTAATTDRWHLGGRPVFTMLNATFECVRLRNLANQHFAGKLKVIGTGSTSYASRTCGVGFCLQDCSRFRVGGLRADNFWLDGVTYDPTANSNGAELGIVKCTNCGSGHNQSGAGNGLTGNWSGAVNSGSTGSTSQRTTITVDALPASAIETYQAFGAMQCHVRISGYLYYVYSIDRVGNTIAIFPWIDPAAGASGTFEWVFGAAHEPRGSNANVVKIDLLDAIRCGKGAAEAALYCTRYDTTIINLCGSAVMVGSDPASASVGLSIDAFYIEGGAANVEHLVCAHRFGNATNSHYIGSSHELDLSKCWMIGDARVTAGNIGGGELGSPNNLTAFTVGHKGRLRAYHKQNLGRTIGSTLGLYGQAAPPVPEIVLRDNHTRTLQVLGSGEYNRLFGFSGGIVGYIGTGTNGNPTGTITFTPPTGGTINGGAVNASVAFTGFTGPVMFLYEHTDTAQLTWKVRPLGGGLQASASGSTYVAPSTTYVAPSGGTTIDTQARASLAQLATDVAAIKTALAQVAADRADIKTKLEAVGLMA